MKLFHSLIEHVRHIMALSREEATVGQRAVQFAIRLVRHGWQELWHDNAPQLAASLTYRTIFGLIPFFVLALLVFRAFGGFEDLGEQISDWLLRYTGVSEISVSESPAGTRDEATLPRLEIEPDLSGEPPTAGTQSEPQIQVQEQQAQARSIRQIISDLEQRVSEVSFTTIGVVGLVLLIWAAIGLVTAVEDAFNQIYRAQRGRSWTMRVIIYWTAITLGPVLVGLSLWLTGQVMGWVDELTLFLSDWVHWGLNTLSRGAALLATWVLLFLLYVLMPNTTVKLRPALVGALVAAVLWEFAKWGFQLYLRNAVGYSALYGTLGLIPLFLLWVYVTWLIILFGLELTYTLQMLPADHPHDGEFESKPEMPEVLLDARWIIPATVAIGASFERGEAATLDDLAEQLALPATVVARLAEKLVQAGLVHALGRGEDSPVRYTLALPPQRIAATRLLELGQALGMDEQAARHAPAHEVVQRIGQAQQAAVANLTLAHMLEHEMQQSPRDAEESERA